MAKYTITAPEPRFNGEFAGLVFRAGKAAAEIPADQAAVTYCQRRGYTVEPLDESESLAAEGDQDAEPQGDGTDRPKDYAPKPEWVAFAVSRGLDKAEAEAATKEQLIAQHGHVQEGPSK